MSPREEILIDYYPPQKIVRVLRKVPGLAGWDFNFINASVDGIDLNQWVNFRFLDDGTNARIWINGEVKGVRPNPKLIVGSSLTWEYVDLTPSAGNFYLGTGVPFPAGYAEYAIADVYFSNLLNFRAYFPINEGDYDFHSVTKEVTEKLYTDLIQ